MRHIPSIGIAVQLAIFVGATAIAGPQQSVPHVAGYDVGRFDTAEHSAVPIQDLLITLRNMPTLPGSPYYAINDLRDPDGLLDFLHAGEDSLAVYLTGFVPPDLVDLLFAQRTSGHARMLITLLILHHAIDDPLLYSAARFPGESNLGSARQEHVAQQDPWVNRSLLDRRLGDYLVAMDVEDDLRASLSRILGKWARAQELALDRQADLDQSTAELQLELQVRGYEWEAEKVVQVRRAFRWHAAVSYVACVLAHLILAIGSWFAGIEFRHAYRTRHKVTAETEMKLSLEGVAIKTSMTGLLLFAITIAFYLLYLKFVYPIVLVSG